MWECMTLDQIETFVAIAQEGGLRAASKILYKTQPTLSTGIKNLEEELGVILLNRDNYRVQLTDAGEALYLKAQEILEHTKKFKSMAQEITMGKELKLNLAIDYLCPMRFLLKILSEYSKKCSTTKLEMDFEVLSGAENKILDNISNLAITPFISKHSKFEFEKICNIKIVPVVSKAQFKSKAPSLEQLLKLPQIVVRDSSKSDIRPDFGTSLEFKQWTVSDHSIKRELILNGFGWGHLEETSIDKELKSKKLIELKLKGINSKNMPLYIVRSISQPFGPVAMDLWKYIINEFKYLS